MIALGTILDRALRWIDRHGWVLLYASAAVAAWVIVGKVA